MNKEVLEQAGKNLTNLKVRIKRGNLCDVSIEGSDEGKIVISSLVGIGMSLTVSEAKELAEELGGAAEWMGNHIEYLVRSSKVDLVKDRLIRRMLKTAYLRNNIIFEEQANEYFEGGISLNEYDKLKQDMAVRYKMDENMLDTDSLIDELEKQFKDELAKE